LLLPLIFREEASRFKSEDFYRLFTGGALSLRGFNLLVPDVGVNGNSAKLGTLTDCSCMLDIAVITSRWALF